MIEIDPLALADKIEKRHQNGRMSTTSLQRLYAGEVAFVVQMLRSVPVAAAPAVGGEAPDIRSFSTSTMDRRCLEVWFARNVTDEDRAWLLAAINEKTAAQPASPLREGEIDDFRKRAEEILSHFILGMDTRELIKDLLNAVARQSSLLQ